MTYTIKTTNGELYHHGILGQKWGKKQGPPYPLDASDHSASEKKAGWRKSLSNKINAAAKSNAKRIATKNSAKSAYKSGKIDKKEYKARLKEANKQNWKEHGDIVKKPIDKERAKKVAKTGALIAGSALAAYGMYKISKGMDMQIAASQARTKAFNSFNKTMQTAGSSRAKVESAISKGETSALAIFDNLSGGNNFRTVGKLSTSSGNPLASAGSSLQKSVLNAENAGVSSSEILKSISDIDDFFRK